MANPPAALAQFQQQYSRYLRAHPKLELPEGIPPRRSQIYESLLFNNVCGFVDKCFPVARSLIAPDTWRELSRSFYDQWQCHTPIFSQIPREFVDFNRERELSASRLTEAPWLPELLHYEWLELEVDLDTANVGPVQTITATVMTNPTLRLNQYLWPVHQLSPDNIPDVSQPVFLCVYRTHELEVKFMEVNLITAVLLEQLQNQAQTPAEALTQLYLQLSQPSSGQSPQPSPTPSSTTPSPQPLAQLSRQQVEHFGGELIEQLVQSQVLIATTSF